MKIPQVTVNPYNDKDREIAGKVAIMLDWIKQKLILKEIEKKYKYPNAPWGFYPIKFDDKEKR